MSRCNCREPFHLGTDEGMVLFVNGIVLGLKAIVLGLKGIVLGLKGIVLGRKGKLGFVLSII